MEVYHDDQFVARLYYVLRQGRDLAERMPAAIDNTLATLSAEAQPGTEQALLEELQQPL
ncbi:hypothetical protein [Halomonas korlensis]|uniref:hypothetical protein n=1 Tax=Halomonas korlensis TaxID=463301 RepID=UPI001587339A|nr:hypothetical protein [Halomonas korlensis]